jgi:Family of unknown function (DUF6062)
MSPPGGPRDATAFEVREALQEPGCAVCRLTQRSVARLLKSVAYEQVNDLALRSALRKRGGFCNAHAHLWLREARSVLGTALIYKDVLQTALRELESPNGQRGGGLLRGLLGSAPNDAAVPCPACQAQAEAESRYVDALLALLKSDTTVRADLESSDGLCRRHTLAAARAGGEEAEQITSRTRKSVEDLVAQLDEVIRKEDYRFRHEPRRDEERTAPARAIAWAAGLEGLVS